MEQRAVIKSTAELANNFFPLNLYTFDLRKNDGSVEEVKREVYMSKNGVALLLYNRQDRKVVLTRQFRLPTFLNNNADGMMIEVCAGLLDREEDPKDAAIREAEEETGYKLKNVTRVFELYSTPGAVSEMLYLFVGEYTADDRKGSGGGLADEHEDIEVLELPFDEAFEMMRRGEIKDSKTVLLLQYAKMNLVQEEKVFAIL